MLQLCDVMAIIVADHSIAITHPFYSISKVQGEYDEIKKEKICTVEVFNISISRLQINVHCTELKTTQGW